MKTFSIEQFTGKYLIYVILVIVLLVAFLAGGCEWGRPKEVVITADMLHVPTRLESDLGVDTLNYISQGMFNDNQVILFCVEDSTTITLEVENAYDQAYEKGQLITVIR